MKIIDALKNVDKSNPCYLDIDDLANELQLYTATMNYEVIEQRLKEYYLMKWYCTDTWVGVSAIYLDGELVGCITQNARKAEKIYSWISLLCVDKVRQVILECMEFDDAVYEIIDPTDPVVEYYSVDYSSQLLDTEGFVNNRHCVVIDKMHKGILSSKIKVRYDNKEEEVVPVSWLKIPIHLEEVQ